MGDRASYSVIVERHALRDESVVAQVAAVATQARPTVAAEVDAAFSPWVDAVTIAAPRRAPKATPAPKLAASRPRPIAHSDDEHTWTDRAPTATANAAQLIDGKYRVEAMLGAGGMGVVVAATHVHLGTTVAIKTLRPEAALLPEIALRFAREARATSRLRSEHVCRALDVGQMPGGEPFIVMEMLHGRDLASLVHADGPLAVADATAYVLQACEAVAEAHSLGMIHRDLKPANLMLTRRADGAPHVKVLDFGIATSATGDIDGGLTRADVAMGSPGYMSPEQLRSARTVDARSDIWSLGVTLYELVAGHAPFAGDTVSGIAIAVATEEPAPLYGVPPGFAAVVARCLRKRASERFATVAELATALAPFVHDGVVRAARIAAASCAVVAPTLMPDALMVARLAATEAPALVSRTAVAAAPIFVPHTADATHRMRRVRSWKLPALALATVAAISLAFAGYLKTRPHDATPAPIAQITATPILP